MMKLKGSEKQVKWAESIREEYLGKLSTILEALSSLDSDDERVLRNVESSVSRIIEHKENIENNDDSKFFIEEVRKYLLNDINDIATNAGCSGRVVRKLGL